MLAYYHLIEVYNVKKRRMMKEWGLERGWLTLGFLWGKKRLRGGCDLQQLNLKIRKTTNKFLKNSYKNHNKNTNPVVSTHPLLLITLKMQLGVKHLNLIGLSLTNESLNFRVISFGNYG